MVEPKNMPPWLRESLGLASRLGARASKAFVASAMDDLGEMAEGLATRIKRARRRMDDRQRREDEDQ